MHKIQTLLHYNSDAEVAHNLTFQSHIDIKTQLLDRPGDGATTARARPRGSGKLLSNIGGVGLALLRIEHALMAEKSEAQFEFEATNDTNMTKTWLVKHWYPEGWPDIRNEPIM